MKNRLHEILRVNHAGEYGAKWIYKGQLYILGSCEEIEHMKMQEEQHLNYFNHKLIEEKVRPTVMQPLWAVGGFTLGACTALLGKKTAHACTIAIESVINEHYQSQIEELLKTQEHTELQDTIIQFQKEEMEHHDFSITAGGKDSLLFPALSSILKFVSQAAIKISEKI